MSSKKEPRISHEFADGGVSTFHVYWEGEIVGEYHTEAEAKAAYLRLSDAQIKPGGQT